MKNLFFVAILLLGVVTSAFSADFDVSSVGGALSACAPCDYPTINTWEAAKQGDIRGQGGDTVAELYASGDGSCDTTAYASISGWDADVNNQIIVRGVASEITAATNTGVWSTDRYCWESADVNWFLSAAETWVKLHDIQAHLTSTSAGLRFPFNSTNSGVIGSLLFYRNYVWVTQNNAGARLNGFNHQSDQANMTAWSNLMREEQGATPSTSTERNGFYASTDISGRDYNIYNNTIIGFNRLTDIAVSAASACRNNIGQDSAAAFSGCDVETNNLCDLAACAGETAGVQATLTFVDKSTGDYHLASTDTAAMGAGVAVVAWVDTDIDFNAWADPPDMGFHEYQGGNGAPDPDPDPGPGGDSGFSTEDDVYNSGARWRGTFDSGNTWAKPKQRN